MYKEETEDTPFIFVDDKAYDCFMAFPLIIRKRFCNDLNAISMNDDPFTRKIVVASNNGCVALSITQYAKGDYYSVIYSQNKKIKILICEKRKTKFASQETINLAKDYVTAPRPGE